MTVALSRNFNRVVLMGSCTNSVACWMGSGAICVLMRTCTKLSGLWADIWCHLCSHEGTYLTQCLVVWGLVPLSHKRLSLLPVCKSVFGDITLLTV